MATDLLKYLHAGVQSYTVPPGIQSLKLHLWGAGGSSGQPGAGQTVQTGTRTEQVQTGTKTVSKPSGTTTITKNGSFSAPAGSSGTWRVPQGTTSVTVTATGGGGGGGSYHSPNTCGAPKGGHNGEPGGNGGQVTSTISVSPNQEISYSVGSGGAGGQGDPNKTAQQAGAAGGATSFGSVSAPGGGGGLPGRGGPPKGTGATGGNGAGGAGGAGAGSRSSPSGGSGGAGSLTVTYTYQETITNYVDVQEPIIENRTVAVYTTYNGGAGGQGSGGAYAFQEIKVDAGDIITFIVGGRGMRTEGGSSLQTPFNFQGGSASGGGGGGGGATVVLKNGNIVAVAGGGGGGGGGSPASGSSAGAAGDPGIPGGIYNTQEKTVYNGQNSNSRGGGGGGGFYGGIPGSDVNGKGSGGRGGGSVGELIDPGSGTNPGGRNTTYFAEASRRGFAEIDGAIIVELILQMSLLIKNNNSWRVTTEQYVKVNNVWKDLRLGWTKVSGQWQPLGFDGTVGTTPVTYSLASNVATVNEGSTVGFTLTTTGLPSGTVIPYTASGIQESDLDQGNMTGSFVVGLTPTVVFTPKANQTTNGARTIIVRLNNTTFTANCAVNDTSTTPIYSITSNVASVNEGQAVRFTVTSPNPRVGDRINWELTTVANGIDSFDVSNAPLSGTFVWGTNQYIDIPLTSDLSRDEGSEQMAMRISGQNTGTRTVTVTVNDTSFTPYALPGEQYFTTPGTYTFSIPLYENRLEIMAIGAGGGGGDAYPIASGTAGGQSQVTLGTITLVRASGGGAGSAATEGAIFGSQGGTGIIGNVLIPGFGTGTTAARGGPIPGARSILQNSAGDVHQSDLGLKFTSTVGAGGRSGSTHDYKKWHLATGGGSGGGALSRFTVDQLTGNVTIVVGTGGNGSGDEGLPGNHGAVGIKWD